MVATLKDLLLSIINATLILVAVCLFLGVKITSNVVEITETIEAKIATIAPVGKRIEGLKQDIETLRGSVQQLRAQPVATLSGEKLDEIIILLEQLDSRAANAEQALASLSEMPQEVAVAAVDAAFDQLSDRVGAAVQSLVASDNTNDHSN